MVNYSTDFSEYDLYQQPSDWTEQLNVNFFTAVVSGTPSLNVEGVSSAKYFIAWDDIGTVADVEVLGKTYALYNDNRRIALRGSGSDSSENCYFCDIQVDDQEIIIGKYVGGSYTEVASYSMTIGDYLYWLRFRVSGTDLKLKCWKDGDEEPGSWQIETTDSSLSTGWVGLGSYDSSVSYWYYFGVATGGGTAPSPSDDITVELDKLVAGCSAKDLSASTGELFETDFSEYGTGSQPNDWTKYWFGSAWLNTRDDGDIGGKCLEASIFESDSLCAVWNDVGSPTDVEALVKVRLLDAGYSSNTGIFVRGSGSSPNYSCYEAIISSSDTFQVRKRTGGDVDYQITSESFTVEYDTWYWIRFQVIGTSLKAKVWEDGDEEPGWIIEETDSDVAGAGWVAYRFSSSSLNYAYGDCDYFAVGTRGLSPDEPDRDVELDKLSLGADIKDLSVLLSEYIIPLDKLEAGAIVKDIDVNLGDDVSITCDKLTAGLSAKSLDVTPSGEAAIAVDTLEAGATINDIEVVRNMRCNLDANIPAIICSASIPPNLSLDAKLPTVSCEGRMGSFAAGRLPSVRCEGSIGSVYVGSLDALLPGIRCEARCGSRLDKKIPTISCEGEITFPVLGRLDKRIPGITCEATGSGGPGARLDKDIPVLRCEGVISCDPVITLDKHLPGIRCIASGRRAGSELDARIPAIIGDEDNFLSESLVHATLDAMLPAIIMAGEGYGSGGASGGVITERQRFEDYILRYNRWS